MPVGPRTEPRDRWRSPATTGTYTLRVRTDSSSTPERTASPWQLGAFPSRRYRQRRGPQHHRRGAGLPLLFLGDNAPPCEKSADVDDSGQIEITDGIVLLGWLFLDGTLPSAPFPECGFDPTGDVLLCTEGPSAPEHKEEQAGISKWPWQPCQASAAKLAGAFGQDRPQFGSEPPALQDPAEPILQGRRIQAGDRTPWTWNARMMLVT